jgi:hypothetical protein
MRRFAILTAGAALVVGSLAIPGMAVANGRTASPQKSTTISAQSVWAHPPIAAQGMGPVPGGHGRHGYHDGRHGHGHHGYYRGGRCYGCDGPGSRCDRYGCAYGGPGYYGYYGDWDRSYDCSQYRGPDGKPAQDPHCKYDQRCDCYYHSSEPPPSETGAAPDQGAQPAPPDQGAQPAPEQGAEPAPEQGGQPQPY